MSDEFYGVFNLVEGCFWIALGIGFLVSLVRPGWQRGKIAAAANFAAFGASDFVEMHTGAWGRPWWLAAWKVTCVGLMAVLLFAHTRRRRAEAAPSARKTR